MTKKKAEKYLTGIKNCKTRVISCETLSHYVGIYPEIIAKDLAFFDPLLAMDVDFDLRDIVPQLEAFLEKANKKEETKAKEEKVDVNSSFKKEAKSYKSIADFVYKKMTINGLVDRGASLSENDLKVLKILVQNDLERR